MSSKWIIETPSNGIMSELCIGKINSLHNAAEPDFILATLKYTIIWKPDVDDDERIGGLQICTDKKLPEFDYMYFRKEFVSEIEDESKLNSLAIKSIFEFNWN